jgi:hypothetical protein
MVHVDEASHQAILILRDIPPHAIDSNLLLKTATCGTLGYGLGFRASGFGLRV